jgi:hypothetical protein
MVEAGLIVCVGIRGHLSHRSSVSCPIPSRYGDQSRKWLHHDCGDAAIADSPHLFM